MENRSAARRAVASKVLRALRHRDFRNELSETGANGSHVVIAALPDDTMGRFFDRLRESGGTIYIAVPEGGEITVLSLAQPGMPPRQVAVSAEPCPIHRDTHLDMVIGYLRQIRGPLPCYEAEPGAMLELVDENPPPVDNPPVTV